MTSEMGEFFNDWRAYLKERRIENLNKAQDIKHLFTVHTEWHWSTELCGHRLDYWPSRNKWRWKNRNYSGTCVDIIRFMHNREKEVMNGKTD